MNQPFISETRYTTTPGGERLTKELSVYELLDKLGIPYEGVDHGIAGTMDDCLLIDEALGVTMCKNLFLRNQQKTEFHLLLMPGDKKFVTKELSKQLGISRRSFAEAEYMEAHLGEVFEGVVSGITAWGIYVELPNTIEGMVALNQMDDDFYEFDDKNMMVYGKRTKKSYRLGDRVVVSVTKVDRMMNTIDFMFEDDFETFED